MLYCRIYVIWGLTTIKNNIGTKQHFENVQSCKSLTTIKHNIGTKLGLYIGRYGICLTTMKFNIIKGIKQKNENKTATQTGNKTIL